MLPAVRTGGLVPTANRLSTIFDRFFDDVFTGPALAPAWGAPTALWEDENAIRAEVDAPGVAESDIDVTVHDGDLIIRFERKFAEKAGGYDTRHYGRFEQRVTLPTAVDAEKVEAKLANGVLSVTCPKSEAAKPRKIAVKAE